jgi:hypothetical protein
LVPPILGKSGLVTLDFAANTEIQVE